MRQIGEMFSDIGGLHIYKKDRSYFWRRGNNNDRFTEFEKIPFYLYYALLIFEKLRK